MKKLIALMLVLVMLVALFAGCAPTTPDPTPPPTPAATPPATVTDPEPPSLGMIEGWDLTNMPEGGFRVGLSNFSIGNSFRVQNMLTFEEEAQRLMELGIISEFLVTNSDGDTARQIADMRDFITMGFDIVLLTAISPTALIPVVEEAVDAGVIVISFDSGVQTEAVTASILLDNRAYGRIQAEWLVEQIGESGRLIMLSGRAGTLTAEDRVLGSMDVLNQFPDIEIIAHVYANFDYAEARAAVEGLIAVHPDIDGIISHGGAMTRAAIDAFDAAGIPLVPMTGEPNNGLLRVWAERMDEGFSSIAPISPSWSSVLALHIGITAATGGRFEKHSLIRLDPVTDDNLMDFVRFDLSDNFWAPSPLSEEVIQRLFGEGGEFS